MEIRVVCYIYADLDDKNWGGALCFVRIWETKIGAVRYASLTHPTVFFYQIDGGGDIMVAMMVWKGDRGDYG